MTDDDIMPDDTVALLQITLNDGAVHDIPLTWGAIKLCICSLQDGKQLGYKTKDGDIVRINADDVKTIDVHQDPELVKSAQRRVSGKAGAEPYQEVQRLPPEPSLDGVIEPTPKETNHE